MSNEQALSPAARHRDAAEKFFPPTGWKEEAIADLALAFAKFERDHFARPSPARDEVLEEAAQCVEQLEPLITFGPPDGISIISATRANVSGAIRALKSQPPSTGGGDKTYAAFQQRRGRLPDLIEEALTVYDEFMKDDAYDAQRPLDQMAEVLRGARDFYDATGPSAPPSTVGEDAVARLMHVIDRDRYAAAIVLNNIKKVLAGYSWLSEAGRGSYAYDDERYQREFGDALEAIEAALTPLGRLAFDKTDCTTDPDKVHAARQAGVERAVHLAS